uniref:Right handed beta helix domain-containing protein n=1 Tax=Amphimedon queenslandica TaxID=400682 RepID=A0A1X7TP69_AMPQE
MKDEYRFWPGLLLVARIPLPHMKCIKKLFRKQDDDDELLLDITEFIEPIKTVDQQKREIVPSSTDIRRCASRESVVEFSCSVSSGQYYVSDDCSSVTQSPCNPLSVYAGNMSQYSNTIFYFIGTSSMISDVYMISVSNVTLHGLDQSSSIVCKEVSKTSISIKLSINITITNSSFATGSGRIDTSNAFDLIISSSVFSASYFLDIYYAPLPAYRSSSELLHYSLMLTNVIFNTGSRMELIMSHGTTYNVSIIFDHVHGCIEPGFQVKGLFYFLIINSLFYDVNVGPGLFIDFDKNLESADCTYYRGIQLTSTLVIEDSQFYNNKQGLKIFGNKYLLEAINYHIIIKSCLIYDNINEGLFIDAKFLKLTQIEIIDTELIGNGGNNIMNSNAISLSNVTVANSTYTGLSLTASLVIIKNDFIFENNTGVVGGGLAINDSSVLIVSSSANLEFIDNHASYKGGGIYSEESTFSDIKSMAQNIPLTLINNTAGLVGGDMYGVYGMTQSNQFNLTNPNISST